MRVFLTKSQPRDVRRTALDRILRSARLYGGNEFTVVTDPDDAELVLYVEDWDTNHVLSEVRHDPQYQRYRDKSIVVCENDGVVPIVPGIYASIASSGIAAQWAVPGSYIWMLRESLRPDYRPDPKYLYCFVGSSYTHPIRDEIIGLSDDRARLVDTGGITHYMRYEATPQEKRDWQYRYDSVIAESAFVLCPRGISPSSVRLYEAMRAGRVPVIIGDECVLPEGPDWDSFSLRVMEADVATIPALLRKMEPHHDEMGKRAKAEWDKWFGPQNLFETYVTWARELQSQRIDGPVRRKLRWFLALTPRFFRPIARHAKHRLLGGKR